MDIRTRDTIKVAHYYYDLGFNQQDIADKLDMSRQRVNRLLKKALNEGIVEIKVHGYNDSNLPLENKLEKKFGLKEALVVDSGEQNALGVACVNYLENNIESGYNIGVTFGSTIAQMCYSPESKTARDISVVQLLGGINTNDVALKPDEIANRLAKILGGKAYSLFVPAIIDNIELKHLFNHEYQNNQIMEKYLNIDIAVVAVGALVEDSILIREGYLKKEYYEMLLHKGCVGDVCFRFIDINGNIVDPKFDQKIMGISNDGFKRIKLRVGVAYGKHKIKPLIAALNGNYINVLATDAETAQLLLNYND